MRSSDFFTAIKEIIEKRGSSEQVPFPSIQSFLRELDGILGDGESEYLKMTRMSILFEGIYRFLANGSSLKNRLLELKIKRWGNHFGTPTVPFLLSYKSQIDLLSQQFNKFIDSSDKVDLSIFSTRKIESPMIDDKNNVIVDKTSFLHVVMPESPEITGKFTKTHNPFGGFTTTPCDPFSQQFIEHAAMASARDGKVLEIGAAFGAATLAALAKGATVFCNDIDPQNLAVVHNRFIGVKDLDDVAADHKNLVLVPGEFPDELTGLPENYFDAILICRVLHFFTGEMIEKSLEKISKLLTNEGKVYIVCETPYLKNWQPFIPEFDKRIAQHVEWPGEITNPSDFESSGRVASLPRFVHWMTKEILERTLQRTGFHITHSAYINRQRQFPDDLLLPDNHPNSGKESVGIIGMSLRR